MRIPKRQALSPAPEQASDRVPQASSKPLSPKSREEKMLQFFSGIEKQQREVSRRKSRFVSEFRNQLLRIPLQHRSKDSCQSESFVLRESPINPRLLSANCSP